MKDGFKARNFWGGAIRALTDEEAGRLIKAVFEYTTTGTQPKLQGAEKGIFLMIASILKEDEEEERRQIENKVKAGAAGGKKRVANQASQAGACSAWKNQASQASACSAWKNQANLAGASDPNTESEIYNINNIYNNNINNLSQNKNMDQKTSKLFSRFWEAYPRHEAKEAAREAFTKLGVDEGLLETMITAIGKWKKTNQWKDEGGRYIPNPANWLRQRRWEDEVPKPAKPKATVIAQQYEQREYDEAYWAEYEAREQREIEEKIALMELEKNKEAGGEKG